MKTLLIITLTVFAAIPWVQHYYWKKNRFSVWKWGGMAMFTVPKGLRFKIDVDGKEFPKYLYLMRSKYQREMFYWGYSMPLENLAKHIASYFEKNEVTLKITRSQLSLRKNIIENEITYQKYLCTKDCVRLITNKP